ncbi:MAG TPA: adenylate cyclase regulatory domain-containing protein [Solirubrobacteraceae bacterium]|nr:adenylate cyclase regulatory domain-containing protein [Solirubrobacteraceae bacterium]
MSSGQIDFAAEGLLDGLEGEQRAERLALLQYLAADGVPLAELRRTTASGTVMFLPAERVIGGRARFTAAEIAQRGEVSEDFLIAVRRAMGLPVAAPEEAIYTEADLEAVRMRHVAHAAGISDEEILDLMRTLGRGLSQAAETMRTLTMRLVLEPGVSEHELAQRYAYAASQLAPMLGPLVTNLLNLHLRQMAQSEAISAAERSGGQLPGSREIAVCFADLVGFTRLGEEVPPDELGRLAVRLEALASDVAAPPVRLIKTIGDAAMLTSLEPEPLLDAALTLLDAAEAEDDDFPQLRAGIAIGPALSRAGDWFGRPVNLASRITAVARPGSVLAEREVRESARESYRWSYAGERRLRGIREPVPLFRARRLPDPA